MRYNINIRALDGSLWGYVLLPYGNFQRIEVPSVVVFDIVKYHSHRYDLHGFFYLNKRFVGPYSFRSKSELYGAIQKCLQENLNIDVQ